MQKIMNEVEIVINLLQDWMTILTEGCLLPIHMII